MINNDDLIQLDLQHIWHPLKQMKDFEQYSPLVINRAKGSYLYTEKGPIIDAIASWWSKSLGHGNPAVVAAIQAQLQRFEHVISAETTHETLAELGKELAAISGLQHVFFASDGSCAVEIAMKLALHANKLKGYPTRNQFVALKNSYHGETLATLSVSDLSLYKKPYTDYAWPCHFIDNIPYVTGKQDPLWQHGESHWERTLTLLEQHQSSICAILIEPILQGAGGMRIYSADFLRQLARFAKQHDIYLIADEIMTGIGRTGTWLACEHAGITADMICLSKGLTSGSLPLSCVLIDNPIYTLFYQDYEQGNSFLHSHTYSGNALAVSAALATLRTIRTEGVLQQAVELGDLMLNQFSQLADETGKITNVRSIGAMVAGELAPHPSHKRLGFELHKIALQKGALLRPIGNTLYWLPPLTTKEHTIKQLAEITKATLEAIYI